MKDESILEFHGGPIDGATILLDSEAWIGEIILLVPSFGSNEKTDKEIRHTYVCCHSTDATEVGGTIEHYMGYISAEEVSNRRKPLEEVLQDFDNAVPAP